MRKYYVIMSNNGLQGAHYHTTREQAQEEANRRNAFLHNDFLKNHCGWSVKELWSYDEYADDERPYTTHR